MLVLINAELADSVCGVIDGVVVGRFLGADAMAAHGIATPIFLILVIFSYIVTVGFQQPCTVAIGRGEFQKANGLYSAGILITVLFSFLLALIGLLFPHRIAYLMGAPASGPIHEMTADYLSAVSLGTPSLLLFLVLIPALQITADAAGPGYQRQGNGQPAHGVDGQGERRFTSISYTLGLLVLLSYYFHKGRFFRFRLRDLDFMNVKRMLGMGLPSGIRVGARALATILISTMVMGMLGAAAMAGLSVQRNLQSLLISLATGVSGAVLLLTGMSFGEQDRRGLMDVARMSAYTVMIGVGATSLLVFLLADPLVSLYLPRTEASFSLAVHAVRWLAVALPLIAWTRCIGSYLQGISWPGCGTWKAYSPLSPLVSCC